jgi:hypothetical protein
MEESCRAYESGPEKYTYLCKDNVIEGNPDLAGLVYTGDNKNHNKNANILWTLEKFKNHCNICSQEFCAMEQRKALVELFKTGKLEGTIYPRKK